MTPSESAYIELATKRGIRFLIDIEDYPRIKHLSWSVHISESGAWYLSTAVSFTAADGCKKQRPLAIARMIKDLEFGDPLEVDHINNNPLDNRKLVSAARKKIRLHAAVKLAENHAMGILESTDDLAFWGEDWFDDHCEDGEWQVLKRAKEIVLNRIQKRSNP